MANKIFVLTVPEIEHMQGALALIPKNSQRSRCPPGTEHDGVLAAKPNAKTCL
jgi:hypothetical protein